MTERTLPVAVIGGGPIGLVAAAQLHSRGLSVKVYEAGASVGTNIRDWGHVRVFTPWRYCVDPTATKLLERQGCRLPPADVFPTGSEIVANYLEPLSSTPELVKAIETGARVTAISRQGHDKVVSRGREERPLRPFGQNGGGCASRSGKSRDRRLRHLGKSQPTWGKRLAGNG